MEHRTRSELDSVIDHIRQAPAQRGEVRLIARRPAEGEREVVEHASLSLDEGLVGDDWRARGSRHTPDGSANRDAQVTLMNVRAVDAIAVERDRWALAGDQLYVDFDLSGSNVPPGTRLRVGNAVVEVSAQPHTGCAKFSKRFGLDALKWVNSPIGKQLNLRGVNARVVEPGAVSTGDVITKA